jgi:hypothetical protein
VKYEHDICIGQDEWIQWIAFDPRTDSELEIDDLLNLTNALWTNLETACIAACCGINAFDLWPDNIKKASKDLDQDTLLQNLVAVRNTVAASKMELVSSDKLNLVCHRQVFVALLDHVIKSIEI